MLLLLYHPPHHPYIQNTHALFLYQKHTPHTYYTFALTPKRFLCAQTTNQCGNPASSGDPRPTHTLFPAALPLFEGQPKFLKRHKKDAVL